MKKLVNDIVNRLSVRNIEFGDVRFTSTDSEVFYFEKGELKSFSADLNNNALGVRVLVDGAWGFCGINEFGISAIDNAIDRAISNARHSAKFKRNKVKFPKLTPVITSYIHRPEIDPFILPREEKTQYLLNIAKSINDKHKSVVFNYLYVRFYRQYKVYANTEGAFVDSLSYQVSPFFQVITSDGNGVQRRTYPGDMSARVGGFEIVKNLDMEGNADRIIKEAVDLLNAPVIEEERADLILGRGQLALQIHESIGHATEADRIFGMEISYAGKTFITPDMPGKFRYGSDKVNIVSDSSDMRGIGFSPVDDEGAPAGRFDIIKNGILVGLQTSREIAPLLNLPVTSNMKASTGSQFPLIRMTNLNLLPGDAGSLADLIKSTANGYFIDHTKSWSIDDNRNNFQFTTEIGWKIRDGEICGIVKEPTYYGITPQFWGACDAVCGESEWGYAGTFNCGKGEPGQDMHLSHGVAPARFRNVVCNIKA